MNHPFLNPDVVLTLLAAHFLGDFVFQTDRVARNKSRLPVLLFHGFQLAALSYLFAGRWTDFWIPSTTFLTHVFIDYFKARQRRPSAGLFLLDQAAHLIVIAVLAWWLNEASPLSFWTEKLGKGMAAV